ncbi:hypothetical protein GYMLUDRAFT_43231 [Collybiopsis luxurians FD-317 M1]|uniref:4-coumarate--CoA ligase n=1 Tax=Collybiopsis luxurians FD-317 M1 TaxID=944289 RepID=A0A0D0CXX5_9AGAR|nr:hypothetical protein GYMLUDRAFT_43231 [Collybiopsis luxurians FD-317 M1]
MSPRIYASSYPSVPLKSGSIFTHLLSVDSNNDGLIGGFPGQEKVFVDAATGTALTRRQFRSLALRFGYGLRHDSRINARRGDTILIFSPNSLAYPVLLLGAIAAGLRCTLANNAYTARELRHQYTNSGANIIISTSDGLTTALEVLKESGFTLDEAEKRIIVAPSGFAWAGGPAKSESSRGIPFDQLLGLGELHEEEQFEGEETTLLCYSSGTTGLPKGVETSHLNLTTSTQAIPKVCGYDPGEQILMFLPFYHIYGVVAGIFLSIICGATTILMPRFDPIEFCISVEKYRVTYVPIVPPVMLAIARHPVVDKYDLSSIRALFCSAAPVSPALLKEGMTRLRARRKPEQVLYVTEGYGMTEAAPATHMLPLDLSASKSGSVGVLLPNFQARLVADDSGDNIIDAEDGMPGELWVKGPTMMKGYLNNPAANQASFTADRWFKTGDMCIRDKEGFYYIVDRKKELIKYKGFQVPPAELEGVLITHPEVADAAVIGVESEAEATELPRAYIVPSQPTQVSTTESKRAFEKSVAQWMETKVTRHKYLRGGVVVIDVIPKSASGKILRRELRELAKHEAVRSKL